MNKFFLSDVSPFTKLIFSFFIILVVFFLIVIVGFVIAIPVFNIDISFDIASLNNLSNPSTIKLLKYFQSVYSIGLFIAPTFVIAYLINKNSIKYLNLNNIPAIKIIIISCLTMIVAIPVINLMAEINSGIKLPDFFSGLEKKMKLTEENAGQITEVFLNVTNIKGLLVNLLVMAIIPAIGEELLFRGIIQKLFIEWTKNIHWGIIIAAFIFSSLHFQFYGFIPRMIMGIFLGYLLVWYKSIWLPIIVHFINNAFAILVYYFFKDKVLFEEFESVGTGSETWIYTIISISVVSAFILLLYRKKEIIERSVNLIGNRHL